MKKDIITYNIFDTLIYDILNILNYDYSILEEHGEVIVFEKVINKYYIDDVIVIFQFKFNSEANYYCYDFESEYLRYKISNNNPTDFLLDILSLMKTKLLLK